MSGTTPTFGFPYPTPDDARGAGANKIRDGFLAVEDYLETLLPIGKAATRGTNAQAIPTGGAWTNVTYEAEDDGILNYDGQNISYSGPPRWFMVSFGATLAVNGTNPSAGLRLLMSGQVATELYTTDNFQSVSAAVPFLMGAGAPYQTATVQAQTNDASGGTPGAVRFAWLRLASMG